MEPIGWRYMGKKCYEVTIDFNQVKNFVLKLVSRLIQRGFNHPRKGLRSPRG